MGWLNYTTGTLATFESAYPEACVLIKDADNGIVAAVYEVGSLICKIYATQHVKVTEYRGLTKDTAEHLKSGIAGTTKVALLTTCGSSWAVVPMLIGTEKNADVSRSNDAGGYKLTVTETTIALTTPGEIQCSVGTPVINGDVKVSWENGTSA